LVKEETLVRDGDSRGRYLPGPKWSDWSMARH
jgi:hypothetical protein